MSVMRSDLNSLAKKLFPIPRSISGPAFRKSVDLLKPYIPFEEHRIPSGSDVLDWVVPPEWELESAKLIDPEGEIVVDSEVSSLHVVNFSESFTGTMDLEDLQAHLYSIPDQPQAVPYVTSYYEPRWGFCLSQAQRDSLKPGKYRVEIRASKFEGNLSYYTANLGARKPTSRALLLSTYLCHPSLGNNELSGPLAMVQLFQFLQARQNRVNYRFLVAPETIGTLAYLSQEDRGWLSNLEGGLVLTCLGGPEGKLRVKLTRRDWLGESTHVDEVARDFAHFDPSSFRVSEFDPSEGSDERQYCSPGFNLPVVQVARTIYGEYPEYHNSGDTLEYMDISAVQASAKAIFEFLGTLEVAPLTVSSRVQRGEPFLSPRKLLPSLNVGGQIDDSEIARIRFGVLSLADGNHTVQQIWRKLDVHPSAVTEQVNILEESNLLTLEMNGK